MKQEETYVAREIVAADGKTQANLYCKRVLASREILSRILKGVVSEYGDYTPEEIAERFLDMDRVELFSEVAPGLKKETVAGDAAESLVPGEAALYYDVKVTARLPKEKRRRAQVYLHINVEAQKEYRPGYPVEKRGIYYMCRMISSQIETVSGGAGYGSLQKVYSIWLCLGKHIPRQEQQTITRFSMTKEDMCGSSRADKGDYDLMELVLIRLGEKETNDKFLGMLDTLFREQIPTKERLRILETDYGIPMSKELKEEVENMCTYADVAEERGIDKGIQQGIRQGEDAFAELTRRMLADSRTEDLVRATKDKEFRKRLYKEYGVK